MVVIKLENEGIHLQRYISIAAMHVQKTPVVGQMLPCIQKNISSDGQAAHTACPPALTRGNTQVPRSVQVSEARHKKVT